MHPSPDETTGGLKQKHPVDFLNYFGKDRWIHVWLGHKRTRLVAALVPPFTRIGLAPDTILYTGIALLLGVVFYFVRKPWVAVLFLLGHMICDGMDGAFARHAGKASQSGAFTDLVCDQLGMVVVAMMAIFHHMVAPLLGAVYIALYLIVVVFGVIINVMGLGTRITITSKLFLYIVFAIWAFWGVNLFPHLMSLFSVLMAGEVIVGYLRLKRGIRRKFDTAVRFREGDPYSGKLNYALNVAVPVAVLLVIIVGANQVPLRSTIDRPRLAVKWTEGASIIPADEKVDVLGLGVQNRDLLVLVRDENEDLEVRKISSNADEPVDSFSIPSYVDPAFSTFPVDGQILLVADNTTRLLLGIELDGSFSRGQAVIVFTLPLQYLRVTAMSMGQWKGKKVWLAANYLYTRKTYLVDPDQALKKGFLLGGMVAEYTNGGFPSGMTSVGDTVIEFNRSSVNALLYAAPLKRAITGVNLLSAGKSTSFEPPEANVLGPVHDGEDLIMLTRDGRVFRLKLDVVIPK